MGALGAGRARARGALGIKAPVTSFVPARGGVRPSLRRARLGGEGMETGAGGSCSQRDGGHRAAPAAPHKEGAGWGCAAMLGRWRGQHPVFHPTDEPLLCLSENLLPQVRAGSSVATLRSLSSSSGGRGWGFSFVTEPVAQPRHSVADQILSRRRF